MKYPATPLAQAVFALSVVALATHALPALAQGPAQRPATAVRTQVDDQQRAILEKVMAKFNATSTLVGKFNQVGPDGRKTEGEFYLQRPGRVRFIYDDPNPVELIADGSAIAVRDRNLATQDIYPISQTPLRFLLADKIDLLRDANVTGIFSDDLFVTVVIEEKSPLTGTHRLRMMFGAKDFQLRQWTITDPQGFDTTVAVYNLDTKTKPDPKLFRINYERMLQ